MATIITPEDLDYKSDEAALEQYKLLTLAPRLTSIAKSKHFVFDIRKLSPGKYSFPYHFHRNAEELIMVLSGSMTLRTPKGLELVSKGQLVFFEMGETGAHQFYNHTDEPCEYLDLRTTVGIDVSEYIDSGKINIMPYMEIYNKDSQVGYNTGEENLEAIWNELKK
jgi:uncharacterized cupin superfamily protein